MTLKRLFLAVVAALLAAAAWYLGPIYQFYAHRGMLPLPPWGWASAEGDAPTSQQLADPRFEDAGNAVLAAMVQRLTDEHLPGLSAAVAIDGDIVWTGTAGYADIASRRALTPDTLFRIGSTSKAITGTALARLVDRGVLELDAPLSTYIPDLRNPAWGQMTARQLASHSAGMPHYKENTDWAGLYSTMALDRHYPSVQGALAVFDESRLLDTPGASFHYSSLGTVLLGAVMGEVSGKSYRELAAEEIFAPAGMVYTFPDADSDSRSSRLASFYYSDGSRFRPWREVDLSHRLPGGGFISSPSDLVRMGSLYFQPGYLSAATINEFWTPQRLADGSINEQQYALGFRWREWDVDGAGLARNANHGGVSRGSQCWLLIYPDYRMSQAFCTNTRTEAFHHFGMLYQDLFREFANAVDR